MIFMTLLNGIDVGDSQGQVDWRKVRGAHVVFAGVKATEGEDFVCRTFTPGRIKSMRDAGVAPMPYHYLRPRTGRTGRVEAEHFVRTVESAGWRAGRDLPLSIDTEETTLDPNATWEYASDFCDFVSAETGRGCVDYLSPGFAPRLANRAPRNGEVAWVAAWDAPDGRPPTPRGFEPGRVLFHQTSDRGHVDGVSTAVDIDVFLGDEAALEAFATEHQVPSPTPPPKPAVPDEMSVHDVQSALRTLGWPIPVDGNPGSRTSEAIRDFQRGFAGGSGGGPLTVDGQVGPRTAKALRWSLDNDGRCSPHFRFGEFASHNPQNHWIKVDHALVQGLEAYRARVGHPLTVVSGYRDPDWNRQQGGKPQSQHLFGNASDLQPELSVRDVKAMQAFSGIGYQGATGLVRHVDVRHRGPNTTGGTPGNPTIWIYE
jgi:zinc D-Ala-D-Ala carboxypeptidase